MTTPPDQEQTQALVELSPPPAGTSVIPRDVPGRLTWFEPTSPEHQQWVQQRESFLRYIDAASSTGKAVLEDLIDGLLEGELPTGILSLLKFTATARKAHKRRQVWRSVVQQIMLLTLTPSFNRDTDFVFRFYQVEEVWRAFSRDDLTREDYKRLYSVVRTRLSAGKLREEILTYDKLTQYVDYKLRQFLASHNEHHMSLIRL